VARCRDGSARRRRVRVARGALAPPSSRESALLADSARTARTLLTCPRLAGESLAGVVNDGGADRISKVGPYPSHVRPGSMGIGCGRPVSSAACPARSRTALANEMQLDLTGHDPKPASRGPGTLRDYGRQTDRTWFPGGVDWRICRSVAIPVGRNGRAVKPSA
jgi:hypothetical protein